MFTEATQNARPALGLFVRVVAFLAVLLCGSYKIKAQEPAASPTPTPSAEETKLTEENKILELKKKNADLKKGIRDDEPQPSSTPNDGKTTVDENVNIETHMVTYKAMSNIADSLGDEIFQHFSSAKAIAIYDDDALQNLNHYRGTSAVFKARVAALIAQYEDLLGRDLTARTTLHAALESDSGFHVNALLPTVTEGVNSATQGLKAFADLLALFRTQTDIKGKSVTVGETALVSETFRALRDPHRFGSNINLYYPQLFSPVLNHNCGDDKTQKFCSDTLNGLSDLYAKEQEANSRLLTDSFINTSGLDKATTSKSDADARLKEIEKKIDSLRDTLDTTEKPAVAASIKAHIKDLNDERARLEDRKARAESLIAFYGKQKAVLDELKRLNDETDQFVSEFCKVDEKTGHSELQSFLQAENMDKAMKGDSYWLELKSISAGGNNRTRQNLFRYFSGAKLDHSGGIIVEWRLYDVTGMIVASNKDSSYEGYKTPKQIQSASFVDRVGFPAKPPSPVQPIASTGKN